MTAYAVAHMHQVTPGPQIVEYLHKIDATLEPFGGRFIVHGSEVEVVENTWPGHLVMIEFPDMQQARMVPLARLSGDLAAAHREFSVRRGPGRWRPAPA